MTTDDKYFQIALKEAEKAVTKGEWPVGCVLVLDGKIIARAHNLSHLRKTKLDHAEIIALKKADKILRLNPQKAILYTTCEPCPMCVSACLVYKIKKIVSGGNPEDSGGFAILKHLPSYYNQLKFKLETITIKGEINQKCLTIFQNYHPKKSASKGQVYPAPNGAGALRG